MAALRVEQAGDTLRVTMDRADRRNAFDADLIRELTEAFADVGDARAVILAGEGESFSAGADVKNARELTPAGDPDLSRRLREIYNPIVLAIRGAPKPVVAAVNGAAAGLGVSLALACDFVLAAERAYFLLAFVHLGVIPDGGATYFLAERIGSVRTSRSSMWATTAASRTSASSTCGPSRKPASKSTTSRSASWITAFTRRQSPGRSRAQ